MRVARCLDCGARLVLRGNLARSTRRHFKNVHGHIAPRYIKGKLVNEPGDVENPVLEMKPEGSRWPKRVVPRSENPVVILRWLRYRDLKRSRRLAKLEAYCEEIVTRP